MIILTLARKPLIGSVAVNSLKHGTGGLNIEASRIPCPPGFKPPVDANVDRPSAWTGEAYNGDHPYILNAALKQRIVFTPSGRYPANLILCHLPGCCVEGTRKVSTSDPRRADGSVHSGIGGHGIYGGAHGEKIPRNYADESGQETMLAWNCQPGCPVAALDQQSGCSASVIRKGGAGDKMGTGREGWRFRRQDGGFEDTGGASRFFKQVGGSGKP